jgi:solute:Na+ symporter, SSS family
MFWIDWLLMAAPVVLVVACAAFTRRYVHGVADFLASGRTAGRYLICNAKGEASSGVTNTLAKFQQYYAGGLALTWWDALYLPVMMLVSLTGFVVYRYRQTRAMTIGQFFEMRYSRPFRLYAGMLGFLAGLLNYGIFPAVSSKFFVYFLGLPEHVAIGPFALPSYVVVMALYLPLALWTTAVGGQVTLMTTTSIEGMFSHVVYLVLIVAIFCSMSWSQMSAGLMAGAHGYSRINPFDQGKMPDFNVWYVVITTITTIYSTMAVQKDNSFSAAARTPHESLMGGVLGNWRILARGAMLAILAIAAISYMGQPHSAGQALLNSVPEGQVRSQMTVPVALRFMLPVGVKGLFCSMMLLGLMAGDSSHIFTWGSIFIQDVVMPIRGRPLEPHEHVRMLRWAVAGVTAFAFVFSISFRQTQYINMWWAITEGIFACGAGAAIIGGLYWGKGTAAGAWAAGITGAALPLLGIVAPYYMKGFPLNGTHMRMLASVAAVLVYVVVSLLTCRRDFDMDRLLHRGKYAVASDHVAKVQATGGRFSLARILGFNAEFTRWDRIIAGGLFFWSIAWFSVLVVGTVWNLRWPWSDHTWANYWLVAGIIVPVTIVTVTLVWFTIGGIFDLKYLFEQLALMKPDDSDDGTVPAGAAAARPGVRMPDPTAGAGGLTESRRT